MKPARANNIGNVGLLLWLAGLFALLSASPAAADKRVALIIGNSAYQNVSPLENPVKDAKLMAETLSGLGFSLVGGSAQLNLDKPGLDRAVQSFGQLVMGADVALFYYAGHGVQVAGANYLVPISANPTREADVEFQMLDVGAVLRQMQGSGTRLNLVILDACRNNPFGGRGLRAAGGGLAQMQAPDGTLIAYATQPGNVAQDGRDGHSPYTKALAATLKQPGLEIFQAFNDVGLAVKRDTGGSQQPWLSSSPIEGRFYFVPSTGQQQEANLAAPAAIPLRADPDRVALTDPALISELNERLYEHNFDPESTDGKNEMTRAITQFQEKAAMRPTGEPTEGLLMRLRQMDDLKPWGSIVYDPDSNKWGYSWSYSTRRSAVNSARGSCAGSKCPVELSFYGNRCGAFAQAGRSWSMITRDSVQKARDAALDECGKTAKSCRIIAAVCADGSGR